MLEKIEKMSNIILNFFLIFALIFVFFQINNVSYYTENDHLAEAGHIPVYLTKEDALNNQNAEVLENPDLTVYMTATYDSILKFCSDINSEKVVIQGTVYSVMKTSTAYTYNVADADGNYYNIIDDTSKFPKYDKTDVLLFYGVPYGISKLNGKEIPSMKVNFIEKVENAK